MVKLISRFFVGALVLVALFWLLRSAPVVSTVVNGLVSALRWLRDPIGIGGPR